jgi:serine/threonine protein phosphatase PrpC
MQGWRIEMEDDHILAEMPTQKDHTFLAVFDG